MESIRRIWPLLEGPGENPGTLHLPWQPFRQLFGTREPSFHRVFLESFRWIRWAVATNPDPGFVLLTAGTDGLTDALWLRAAAWSINAAVVGRHTDCPLHLEAGFEVSLRHAAIIVGHQRGPAAGRLRLVDLRSASGLVDEQGRRWHGLESDGPVAVRMGGSVLMGFPTGSGALRWPDDAEEAWRCIPPRRYHPVDEVAPEIVPPVWLNDRSMVPEEASETLVRTWPAPLNWSRSLQDEDEAVRGVLRVRSREGEACLRVGSRALGRGILLGRYSRCDNDGVPVLADRCFSRVHALVIAVDCQVHAIDTGSKNGLWQGARRVRRCLLGPGDEVELAGEARVSWLSLQ